MWSAILSRLVCLIKFEHNSCMKELRTAGSEVELFYTKNNAFKHSIRSINLLNSSLDMSTVA